jgi:hypothetical protein
MPETATRSKVARLRPELAEWIAHAGIASVYLALFLQQASEPYTIDEAAFPYGAAAILEKGIPQFYNGETRPQDLGLWHPPLYIYTLAAQMLVLGESQAAVRSYGALAVIVAWIIGLAILRRVYPSGGTGARCLFSSVFLLNPLILAGSLVPDIDGTIGIVLVMSFLWLGTRIVTGTDPPALIAVSVGIWLFSFSTKFTTTLLMVPLVALAAMLAPRCRIKHLGAQLAAILTGGAAFLLLWYNASRLLNAPFPAPFDYFKSGLSRSQTPGGAGPVSEAIATLAHDRYIAMWLICPLLLFSLGSAALAVLRPAFSRERHLAIFYSCAAGGTIVAYAAITSSVFTFPKYWGAAVPAAALASASGAFRATRRLARTGPLTSIQATLAAAAAALIMLAALAWSSLVIRQALTAGEWTWPRQIGVYIKVAVGLLIASFLALGWPPRPQTRGTSPSPRAAMRLVAVALAGSLATLSLAQDLVTRSLPFSTRYYFGERGLQETIDFLRLTVGVDERILAAKDIGLQSGRRFYEDAQLYYGLSPEAFASFLQTTPVRAVVTRKRFDYAEAAFPAYIEVIQRYFTPVENQPSLDMTVWMRTNASA